MIITIPHNIWDAELREMRQRHSDLAGTKQPTKDGTGTEFIVSDLFISKADFDMLLTKPVKIDKAKCWIEVDASVLDETVGINLPDSTFMDNTDPDIPLETGRAYYDYVPSYRVSNDGLKVVLPVCHTKHGGTTANGCMDEELRLWIANLGPVLCEQEYNALMSTDNYKEASE